MPAVGQGRGQASRCPLRPTVRAARAARLAAAWQVPCHPVEPLALGFLAFRL